MSDCVNDFWNSVGARQLASGGAPSVRTKEIKEVEAGKRSIITIIPENDSVESVLVDAIETIHRKGSRKWIEN